MVPECGGLERRLDGPVLGEVVLVLDELALAALGRAGLLFVAVKAVAAAPLAAGARVLPVALALHSMAGVAGRAQEHRAGGVLPKHNSAQIRTTSDVFCGARGMWEQSGQGSGGGGLQACCLGIHS